jgi:hypothetical protein
MGDHALTAFVTVTTSDATTASNTTASNTTASL